LLIRFVFLEIWVGGGKINAYIINYE